MTHGHTCTVCHEPIPDQGIVCHACWDRTVAALASLGALMADLDITITGQGRMPFGSSGSGGVPYDQKAAGLRDTIRAQLVGWCLLLHEDHHMPLPNDTIVDMAHAVALSDLRMHEAAGEAVAEITSWPAAIRTAVDWPAERSVVRVWRCPQGGEGWQCEGWLHVHHPTEGTPYVSCHACGARWETLEQMDELRAVIVSQRASARLLTAIFGRADQVRRAG